MRIASMVLRVAPENIQALTDAVLQTPGAEVHGTCREQGRMIVTVEDGPDYSVADSLVALSKAPHVLAATLAYEYSDEGLESQEA